MNKICLTLLLSILFQSVQAQNEAIEIQKKNFSIEQAVVGMWTDFRVKDLKQLKFMGKSNFYSFIRKKDGLDVLYAANVEDHEAKPYMDLEQLNLLLESQSEDKVSSFPSINWFSARSFYFKTNETYYKVIYSDDDEIKIRSLLKLPKGAEHVKVLENPFSASFVKDDNLAIQTEKIARTLSKDGSADIVYGQAVHRQEFGITDGMFWSPKGKSLAFYRMDQSMVNDYPVVNWSETPASVKNIKYPMAGGASHHVTLGVHHLKDDKTIYINTEGPKEQYLTSISWSPDEEFVYVGLLNRGQDHLKMNQYYAADGSFVKTLFEEKHSKYVEPQHSLNFYNKDPESFIWMSQRDGYMHMYLYDKNEVKQITKGKWIVNSYVGYNKVANEIVFTGTKDGPTQKNVYAVKLDDLTIRNVSAEEHWHVGGWHSPILSKNGSYMIDKFKNNHIPNAIDVVNINSKSMQKRILSAPNPLQNYKTARTKLVQVKSDGNLLYGKLIYPTDFDSTKKYPAIVYVYNGPHVQLVKDVFPFSGNLWYDYMAQRGYFVYVMDGRGSSNRGLEFENATFRKMGQVEMRDQMQGVAFLKSLPYIDEDRLGVHGWSYGGFMTTSLMTSYPDVFKVGVAGGPVMDWKMYEVMYTERYMDDPQSNAAGYSASALIDKVDKLEGKLLLIHGAQDDVVVWQHSMKFIRESVKQKKQVDYFVYPSHPHNVRGFDRIHLMQKVTDYFDLHLK